MAGSQLVAKWRHCQQLTADAVAGKVGMFGGMPG
jgi:hypothetical protein